MLSVSLLLPSFKRAHLLKLGLYSIARQNTKHNLEIVVVNDGPNDDTEAICKVFPELNIRYIFTGQRHTDRIIKRGPTWALNIGIKQCTHDTVILSCPEMFHLNNTIDILVDNLIQNPKSMVIPDFIYFDNEQIVTNNLIANVNTPIDTSKLLGGEYGKCHVVMPFLMALHKRYIMDMGGWDEDFTGYCAEDNDIVERLKLVGLTHYRTNAEAIHLYHGGSTDGGCHWNNPEWVHNFTLLNQRRGIIKRNEGREWGVLQS